MKITFTKRQASAMWALLDSMVEARCSCSDMVEAAFWQRLRDKFPIGPHFVSPRRSPLHRKKPTPDSGNGEGKV